MTALLIIDIIIFFLLSPSLQLSQSLSLSGETITHATFRQFLSLSFILSSHSLDNEQMSRLRNGIATPTTAKNGPDAPAHCGGLAERARFHSRAK